MISSILFCIYIDSLLGALKNSAFGCYIGRVFLGVLAYADDIVLLAPPATMRAMLAVCDNYADALHIVFNAKKSKCMYIEPSLKIPHGLPELHIGDTAIEFVEKRSHLGHTICHT